MFGFDKRCPTPWGVGPAKEGLAERHDPPSPRLLSNQSSSEEEFELELLEELDEPFELELLDEFELLLELELLDELELLFEFELLEEFEELLEFRLELEFDQPLRPSSRSRRD
ncbi:hypothetical protein ACFFP0_17235 [Rhizobium puerariae]|uniref:Uncharacterized protein n=1 Tax=Rhizobium puerariae TaxID=1585791 RepID=A0ABV6AJ09_9HYPH